MKGNDSGVASSADTSRSQSPTGVYDEFDEKTLLPPEERVQLQNQAPNENDYIPYERSFSEASEKQVEEKDPDYVPYNSSFLQGTWAERTRGTNIQDKLQDLTKPGPLSPAERGKQSSQDSGLGTP